MNKELEALESAYQDLMRLYTFALSDKSLREDDAERFRKNILQFLRVPTEEKMCGLIAKDLGLKNVFFKNYCFKFNPDGYDYTIIKYDEINDRIENYSQSALSVETTLNLCLFLKSVREEIAREMLIISHSKRLGKY